MWFLTESRKSFGGNCDAGRLPGLSEKVDFVIGIGGGSPMDASKAIALMIANPEKKADFLYETDAAVKQAANKALTVAAVPTTAGTGSEVTPYAILTRIVMPKNRTDSRRQLRRLPQKPRRASW